MLLLLLLCLLCQTQAKSRHRQMTMEVTAGADDCFFVNDMKIGQTLSVEYQVTSSSVATGKNDITVRVQAPPPALTPLYEGSLQTEGSWNGEAEENGDYKVCFDNRASSWSDKIVWFEINVEDPEDDYDEDDDEYFDADDWDKMKENNEDTMSLFEMKIEDIKTAIHDVRINVGKMRHFQFMRGGAMSKDVHQVEANLTRLNFWSLLYIFLMVVVGVTQVYTVRQLFENKSMVQKIATQT